MARNAVIKLAHTLGIHAELNDWQGKIEIDEYQIIGKGCDPKKRPPTTEDVRKRYDDMAQKMNMLFEYLGLEIWEGKEIRKNKISKQ